MEAAVSESRSAVASTATSKPPAAAQQQFPLGDVNQYDDDEDDDQEGKTAGAKEVFGAIFLSSKK